ncbi:hypothetical protein [Paenibacillus xerothermodurans]|uniref:Uncharacterized protein n=1 Tax=Paenibacillus xerothermodurans TaxID=1977292 RepID=A0A2W1NYD3_PAEXE|nr:hypothetical protein [Paenibacillus xerothermodurans]PZE20532.1 hypothetical protein CBW46_012210 [Paenibacillus xerothermodurans]
MSEQFDHMSQTEKSGDTKVTGGYIITKLDHGLYDVHIGLEVVKEGRSGKGYGTACLVVDKADGSTTAFGPLYQTEEADDVDGYHRGYTRQDKRTRIQFEDPNEVVSWYLALSASESEGTDFPRSLDDLNKMLKENAEALARFGSIAVGGVETFGILKVFRTGVR